MHLIKNCPACGKRIRFPLDKGVIKVRCACGYDFKADPDDTAIYRNASFDLTRAAPRFRGANAIRRILTRFDLNQIIPAMATGAFNVRYRIQNFRLLPDSEKRKIVFLLLLIAACLAGLIAAAYALSQTPDAPDAMVI